MILASFDAKVKWPLKTGRRRPGLYQITLIKMSFRFLQHQDGVVDGV